MSLYDDYLNQLNTDDDEEIKVSLSEQYKVWQQQTPSQRAATKIEVEKEKPPLVERIKAFGRGVVDIFKKPEPPKPEDVAMVVNDRGITADKLYLNVVEQNTRIGGEVNQTKDQLVEAYLAAVKENPMMLRPEKPSYGALEQPTSAEEFKEVHRYVLESDDDTLRQDIRNKLEQHNYAVLNINDFGKGTRTKEIKELEKEYRNQAKTAEIYSEIVNEGANDGDFRERMSEGFSVPFGTTFINIGNLWDLAVAGRKNVKGEELTDAEKAVLETAAAKKVENTLDPKGWGYIVGSILAEAPAFMGEYGLTSFVAAGVSGTVQATPLVTKIATKSPFLAKVIGALAGVTAQVSTGFLPRVLEQDLIYATQDMELVFGEEGEILMQNLDADEDFSEAMLKNLPKAYAVTWTEVASEKSGEALRQMKTGILVRFFNKHPPKSTEAGVKLLARFGWHGVIEEVLEEEIAYLGQSTIEGEEIKLPVVTQEGTERLILETMGIGLLGTVMSVPTQASSIRYNKAVKEMHKIGKKQGLTPEQVNEAITDMQEVAQEATKIEEAVTPVEEPTEEPAPEVPEGEPPTPPVEVTPVTPVAPKAITPKLPAETQQLVNEAKILGRKAYDLFLKDEKPRVPAQDAEFMKILEGIKDSRTRITLMEAWRDAYTEIPDAEAAKLLEEPTEKKPVAEPVPPAAEEPLKIEPTRQVTQLVEGYASAEAQIKKLVVAQDKIDAQVNPNAFQVLTDKINEIETGNRSAVKQIVALTGSNDYNVIGALSSYIDGGQKSILDFYNNVAKVPEATLKPKPVEKAAPKKKPAKKKVTKTARKKVEAKKKPEIYSVEDNSVRDYLTKKHGDMIPIYHGGADIDLTKTQLQSSWNSRENIEALYFTIGNPVYTGRGTMYRFDVPVDYLLENASPDFEDAGNIDNPEFLKKYGESADDLDMGTRAWTEYINDTSDKNPIQIMFDTGGEKFNMPNEYFVSKVKEETKPAPKPKAKAVERPKPKVVKPEGKGISQLVTKDKDSVAYQVLTKYGAEKKLKDLTAKEIGSVLSEQEGLIVPYSEEVAKKFGSVTRAIDLSLLEDRPVFIYGAVSQSVFTDGFILILNQTAAKEFNEKNIERFTNKERKMLMKEQGLSHDEAQKIAEEQAKTGIKEMAEQYPEYEKIIPKRSEMEKAEIVGITAASGDPIYILKSKKYTVFADGDKMEFMKKATDYDSLYIKPDKPVLLYKHDTKQGLVMPFRDEDLSMYRAVKESYEKKEPTKAHSSVGLADLGGYDLNIEADVEDVSLEELKKNLEYLPPRVEFPELIRIIKNVMGEVPSVKVGRKKGLGVPLGTFYAKDGVMGRGRMNLHPSIFIDAQLMGRVGSHELGHLTDYLPQPTMAKGNLLGRITSLRNFMRQEFTGLQKESQLKMLKIQSARWSYERTELKDKDGNLPETNEAEDAALLKKIKAINKKIKAVEKDPLLKQKEVHEELSKLTQAWKPFPEQLDREGLTNLMNNTGWSKVVALKKWEQYVAYRYAGEEMYADAVSVLFNEPALLREVAPEFYKGFFQYLNEKPSARENFFAIWDLINKGEDAIATERQKEIRAMFQKGEDIAVAQREEKKMKDNEYVLRMQLDFIDRNSAVINKVRKLKKEGVVVPDNQNPEYLLAAHNYVGGVVKNYVEENIQPLYKKTKENDLTWEDVGEVLFLQRVIQERGDIVNPVGWIRDNKPVEYENIKGELPAGIEKKSTTDQLGELKRLFGNRIDLSSGISLFDDLRAGMPLGIANPLGMTSETSQKQLDYLKRSLGVEKWNALMEIVEGFRKATDVITEMAKAEGLWKPELIKLIEANPAYATFQVLDYMEDYISARVSHQVGTLKDIANVADATIMKSVSIIRAVERNKVKRSLIDLWARQFPEEIQEANYVFTGKARIPVAPKNPKMGLITVVRGGKLKGYYMSKYVTQTIQNTGAGEINAVAAVFRIANNRWFRPLFITFNLGFQTFNLKRDFERFYKNLPDMTLARAVKAYVKAAPSAFKRAWAVPDATISEMEKSKILGVTWNDVIRGATSEDKRIDVIMARTGVTTLKGKERIAIVKRILKILDLVSNTGDFIESLPKVAAYQEYKGKMPTEKLAQMIRTQAGSPDFLTKGRAYNTTNNIFLFSNAITQGIRSDISVATKPESRGDYWLKTIKVNILPKVVMWAGLIGLFGDKIKEMLEDVSEYDMTNYIIIPLGEDVNGKTIYVRVPQDESGRLIAGIFWKALRASNNNVPIMQDVGDILSFTGGQLPSLTPAISAIFGAAQYAAGQNPYDFFRNRPVIPEKEFNAGMTHSLKPFINWELQQIGLGTIWRGYVSQQAPETKTWVQKIGETPILANIWGRWVKVSDYGTIEKNRRIIKNVKRENDKRLLNERNLLDDAVKEYRGGSQSITRRNKIQRQLVKDIVGNYPYSGTRKAKKTRTETNFKIALLRGTADANLTSLISANTNAEKTALLKKIREDMSYTEFNKLKRLLINEKIVSENVFKELGRK